MRRRIIAGVGANSFGMGITIAMQLLSLPIFLHYWDTSTYGTWLMLSAIPAYLSMSDVGMVTTAGNKMTMAMGRGDSAEANQVFQSAQLFMVIICGALALLAVPIVLWAPIQGLDTMDKRLALAAMSLGILASLFGGLAEAVFKSTNRYAIGTMLSNLVRLAEWLGIMSALVWGGGFATVACGGFALRLLGVLTCTLIASRGSNGLKWGMQAADRMEIRAMMKPALSFMAFPLANALSFQGVTLLVGAFLGPSTVAIFNTYRTIARVTVQVTAMFSHALWPEFAQLYGQGYDNLLSKLFRRSAFLGTVQAIVLSTTIYFISPWMLKIWTHGAIAFVPDAMQLMLAYAAIAGIWHVPRVLLMATNQHIGIANWSVIAGVLAIVLTYFLEEILQVNGAIVAMLVSELFIATICTLLAYRSIQQQSKPILSPQ